ncbi:DUF6233 domain-containing protein [Streptomyces sp. NPDC046859]|uniref:DUF6233 domain-containing protein n=1 Tax=Streptomyces sp. NPDC046859 TaxID=3155734 RepID=UPI0033C3A3AD
MGADRSPVQVHAGDCHMAGQRRRAVSRDEARRLLATGLEGCSHCRPAARLHIIELEPPPPTSPVPVTHLMACPASAKRPRRSAEASPPPPEVHGGAAGPRPSSAVIRRRSRGRVITLVRRQNPDIGSGPCTRIERSPSTRPPPARSVCRPPGTGVSPIGGSGTG